MADKLIGSSVRRKEDRRMIRGLATYVDDLDFVGLHHVAILRSPFAHAHVRSIDASAAMALPGVIDVVTGADTEHIGGVLHTVVFPSEVHSPKSAVLAEGRVRFVGEPIAAVVAETRAVARDALELIAVDYEQLEVVSDPESALAAGAPIVHEGAPDNLAFEHLMEGGELTWKQACEQADRIVEQRIVHQRLAPCAMEPRGVIASFDPGREETVLHTSTQIPHFVRTFVAIQLGIPESKLRVIAPDVGGGFGSKLNVYREEALLCFLARRTGKPVKWIERRSENLQSTIHGRGQVGTVRVACNDDGRMLGLHYDVVADLGAYHQLLTAAMPAITGLMLSGNYAIPHVTIHVRGAFTNRMSTDAYRGAGRPEATFTVERATDLVALELGMDPVDVRRLNFPTEFPYTTATGLIYDSGDYKSTLEYALQLADYDGLRRMQAEARAAGRLFGIGISTYCEICGMGRSDAMPTGGFGWESATVRVHPTGSVTVLTGISPHGQGQETAFAQIAGDMLGIGIDEVDVVHSDTGKIQYGVGTFGSRGLAVGGTALVRALEQVIAKGKELAAHLLGAETEQVTFSEGVFRAPDGTEKALGEIAFASHTAASMPTDGMPGLEATVFHEPGNFTFPFGTHICVVEVDAETGEVAFQRYVAVDDCGKVVNPMLVDGQIQGGIAQGLGQALYEQVLYDEDGQLISGSFMDYCVPKAHQIPRMETDRTVTPTPVNPLGAKGAGEAGTIGSTPALVNAVCDALKPLGVRHLDVPLTPQRVWEAMQRARRAEGVTA